MEIVELSVLVLKKFKDTVERILHVPGNYTGKVLEMTVAADNSLTKEELNGLLPQLLKALKMHSKIFQNVRFNYVLWTSDDKITNQVCPMMSALLDSFYENYECVKEEKHLEKLAAYLKKFHARSKLIIVLTDGTYRVGSKEELRQEMEPFLGKKLMFVVCKGEEIKIEYRNLSLS